MHISQKNFIYEYTLQKDEPRQNIEAPTPLKQENINKVAINNFSFYNVIYETIKNISLTTVVSLTDFKLSKYIESYASRSLGICLNKALPHKDSIKIIDNVIKPIVHANEQISVLFGDHLYTQLLFAAVCEEVEFRWFVQKILLHQLPKQFIEKTFSTSVHYFDTLPAKASRVALSSLIFALAHTNSLECTNGGGISVLLGGLLYGSIYEFTDLSLVNCINLHYVYNLLIAFSSKN